MFIAHSPQRQAEHEMVSTHPSSFPKPQFHRNLVQVSSRLIHSALCFILNLVASPSSEMKKVCSLKFISCVYGVV